MNRKPVAVTTLFACIAVLSLAACQQQEPPAEPAEPVAEAAPPTEPAPLIPTANPDGGDFDHKGFAGNFEGTLPCADCPGIDTTLQLAPDGTYVLGEVYQEGEDGAFKSEGTWAAEADGKQIRLDPASKSEEDRLYAIASQDELVPLGSDGEPAASGNEYRLTRSGRAQ